MASCARASEALHSAKASSGDVKIRVPLFIVFPPGLSFCAPKEEAPAMSGAPTDRGFHRRETGMDQGTTPKAKIIGLLGKKKKPRPSVGWLTKEGRCLHIGAYRARTLQNPHWASAFFNYENGKTRSTLSRIQNRRRAQRSILGSSCTSYSA